MCRQREILRFTQTCLKTLNKLLTCITGREKRNVYLKAIEKNINVNRYINNETKTASQKEKENGETDK